MTTFKDHEAALFLHYRVNSEGHILRHSDDKKPGAPDTADQRRIVFGHDRPAVVPVAIEVISRT